MNVSKTRKHLNEHEPRTRKKKVEAAREADVDVPPRSQLHGRVDELAFVLGGGSLDEEHSEHTDLLFMWRKEDDKWQPPSSR